MNTDSHFPVKHGVAAPVQERSRATAVKLVEAATRLLKRKTYAELSIAELAREAGRSVGVFYQRFGSKDDFLSVLLTDFFERSAQIGATTEYRGTAEEIYALRLEDNFRLVSENRNLWHAALQRAAVEPGFWRQYGMYREGSIQLTVQLVEGALGRPLSEEERRRMALAGQVFNSVINNQIINGPGPLMLESEDFFPELRSIVLAIARMPQGATPP